MIPTYLKDKEGNVIVNPLKDYVRPFWLNTDEPDTEITVGANLTVGPRLMTVTHEGHFEGIYFTAQRTGAMTLLIHYPAKRMNLMNREIHLDTFAGSADRPFVLPETFFIPSVRAINVTFRDLTGAPNTVRFSIIGRRFYHYEAPQELAKRVQDFAQRRERSALYFLTTDEAVTLTANQTREFFATVSDDGDFEWFKTSVVSTGAFTATVADAQTGRNLMNGAVQNTLLTGDANFPFVLPETYLVRRSLRLRITFTDLSGAPNTIFWTMAGRRIYYETAMSGIY